MYQINKKNRAIVFIMFVISYYRSLCFKKTRELIVRESSYLLQSYNKSYILLYRIDVRKCKTNARSRRLKIFQAQSTSRSKNSKEEVTQTSYPNQHLNNKLNSKLNLDIVNCN